MKSTTSWQRPALACCALLASCLPGLAAQSSAAPTLSGALTVGQLDEVSAKRGGSFVVKVPLHLKAGYHCNSNTPADEYLIPLRLTWSPGPARMEQVIYPKPQRENYAFSQKPVSVFSGTFVVETRFKTSANTAPGRAKLNGKLRYQACNEKECLPPRTIDVEVPVDLQ